MAMATKKNEKTIFEIYWDNLHITPFRQTKIQVPSSITISDILLVNL